MRVLIKVYSFFVYSLLTMIFASNAFSQNVCVHCGKSTVEGAPNVPLDGLAKVAAAVNPKKPIYSFESHLGAFCMNYTLIIKTQVAQAIRDLNETNYPVDDFFTKAECEPLNVGGLKVPVLHLTAEAPCGREEFLPVIYKYYNTKRKDPKMWLKVINAKNSRGETFLDYLEFLRKKQEDYSVAESKACMSRIMTYACQKGAVYSVVKDKTCPEHSGI